MQEKQTKKRELTGKVISNKMQEVIVVEVETKKPHPLYKKIVKSWKKYKAHTKDSYEVGDQVIIRENRPISKQVRWIVIRKIEK